MGNVKIAPKIVATNSSTGSALARTPSKKSDHPVLDLAVKLTDVGKPNRTLDKTEWQQLKKAIWAHIAPYADSSSFTSKKTGLGVTVRIPTKDLAMRAQKDQAVVERLLILIEKGEIKVPAKDRKALIDDMNACLSALGYGGVSAASYFAPARPK